MPHRLVAPQTWHFAGFRRARAWETKIIICAGCRPLLNAAPCPSLGRMRREAHTLRMASYSSLCQRPSSPAQPSSRALLTAGFTKMAFLSGAELYTVVIAAVSRARPPPAGGERHVICGTRSRRVVGSAEHVSIADNNNDICSLPVLQQLSFALRFGLGSPRRARSRIISSAGHSDVESVSHFAARTGHLPRNPSSQPPHLSGTQVPCAVCSGFMPSAKNLSVPATQNAATEHPRRP
jgi:hypothetical protein